MSRSKVRWTLAALAMVAAAFVAVGGPATAARWIDGGDIKPGSIEGRQIADGAVSADKLSRRAKRALKGATGARGARGAAGPAGAAGAAGAAGQNGARGPAGAFNVVDTQNRVIGDFVGWYSPGYPQIYTAAGAILTYDSNVSTNYLYNAGGSTLYYKQAACTGTAYANYNSSYPLQAAIVLESPPGPGSRIYVTLAGTPENFTYQSYRSSSGCTTSSSSTSNQLPVKEAGVVPSVQKPLQLIPAS
ncbi:MAG TPA: hypothetical protein VGO48_14420 [Conexibacter sp.]|jgi:hypothetical protein|nr:hypothetical protein [Conexibacter sp.]